MNNCNKFQVSRQVLMKISNIEFQNPSIVSRTDARGLADAKTDITKLISFYRECTNRPISKGGGTYFGGPLMKSWPDYIQLKVEIHSYRDFLVFLTGGDWRILKISHICDNRPFSLSFNVELRVCVDGILYDINWHYFRDKYLFGL
jgi:hypothetical protein